MNDSITIDNHEVYLFDIANKIREKKYIDDAMVLSMPIEENDYNLVAHIVWNESVLNDDKTAYINDLDNFLKQYLPKEIVLNTYSEHDIMLPYSPTTLKKDKNKLSNQTSGYVQVIDGKLVDIEYFLLSDGKHYFKLICNKDVKKLVK